MWPFKPKKTHPGGMNPKVCRLVWHTYDTRTSKYKNISQKAAARKVGKVAAKAMRQYACRNGEDSRKVGRIEVLAKWSKKPR